MSKIFGVILLLSGLSLSVVSQVSSTAGASINATVVQPVSTTKTVNTEFGNGTIIVSADVAMTPVGVPSKKGDIVLPVSYGTFTAATYYFSGNTGYTYNISFPTSPIIIKSGSNSWTVSSFVNNTTRNSGSDLIGGVFVSVTSSNITVNYN
jgi:hypothetical protein